MRPGGWLAPASAVGCGLHFRLLLGFRLDFELDFGVDFGFRLDLVLDFDLILI